MSSIIGKKLKVKNQEVERKFMAGDISEVQSQIIDVLHIQQQYFSFDKSEEGRVRTTKSILRPCEAKHELCIKRLISNEQAQLFSKEPAHVREEFEVAISRDMTLNILAVANSKYSPLEKYRTEFFIDGVLYELDNYFKQSVMIVEVEFETQKEAELFVPPSWLGEECKTKALDLWKMQNNYKNCLM